MRRHSFSSLRVRLLLLILITILPAFGLAVNNARQDRNAAAVNNMEAMTQMVQTAAFEQDRQFESTRQLLVLLSMLPSFQEGDWVRCSSCFAEILKVCPSYQNISVVAPDGNVICSALPLAGPLNVADRYHIKTAIEKRDFTLGHYQINRINGVPNIVMAFPVIGAGGEVRAIISAATDLLWLGRSIAGLDLPPGSVLSVIDRNGTILARYPDEEGLTGRAVPEAPVAQAILNHSDEHTTIAAGPDGVTRFYAFKPLDGAAKGGEVSAYIYAGVPTLNVEKEINKTLFYNLTVIGLLSLLIFALAWAGGDLLFLRQVNSLLDATRRIASGDLGFRVWMPRGSGEFGQLGEAFIQMSMALETRTRQLERSEARYRKLVEQVPALTYTAAPADGYHFLYASPRSVQLLGLPSEDLVADAGLRLKMIHHEDCGRVLDEIAQSIAAGRPYCSEYRVLSSDGRTIWVRDEARMVKDDASGQSVLQGLLIDITRSKLAEDALRRKVTDLSALYDASKVFIGQTDVQTALENSCRLAVERLDLQMAWVGVPAAGDYEVRPVAACGFDKSYLKSIRVTYDVGPTGCGPTGTAIRTGQAAVVNRIDDDAAYTPWRNEALSRGYRSSAALPLLYGETVLGALNLYSAEPEYFSSDRLLTLQSFANLTAVAMQKASLYEQVQNYTADLERRVEERTIKLQEINDELESFAYSVSHDLRAPLRAMEGFSNALLEDYYNSLDQVAQDYLRRIFNAARHMDTLIGDLLAYSRISRADLQMKTVSLTKVIGDALARLETELAGRRAEVKVEEPLPAVMGHHATLVQITANLLENAARFVEPGVRPAIRVWAEERDGRVRLWVEDNGIGIAPEHRERIFRIFERLHGIETYPGTGVGLAIVRKGSERMNGNVGVESEPGKGSSFWVELLKGEDTN